MGQETWENDGARSRTRWLGEAASAARHHGSKGNREMDFWEHLGAVIFDMDGVLFIGNRLRAGVIELVDRLNALGIDFHILTNTGSSSSTEIAAKLDGMGLKVEARRITTSSALTAGYVAEHTGAKRAWTLGGGTGLSQALEARGIEALPLERMSMEEARTSAASIGAPIPLVVGWTRDYDHQLATRVLRLERAISEMYVASEDRAYPGDDGLMPGVLWLSASVAALIQKRPINPAKPNRYALEYVLRALNQPAARVALIGDSISDIESGNQAGCRTVLVLGGATPRTQVVKLSGEAVPLQVIEELTDLL